MKTEKATVNTVKIKFNHPMQNKNITHDMYKAASKAYFDDVVSEHGKKAAVPYEPQMILYRVEEMYGQPYFYLPGTLYEMPQEDADYYLAKHRLIIDPKKQRYIGNVAEDLHRYQIKFNYAELVA